MNTSKVFQIANDVFGDNLIDIGVGGSLVNDIDSVVILKKIDKDQIKEYLDKAEKATKQRISVKVYTKLMRDCNAIDSKTAIMLYKGMRFQEREESITRNDAAEIIIKRLPDNLQNIIKANYTGKLSDKKTIDLLVQLLTIIWDARSY